MAKRIRMVVVSTMGANAGKSYVRYFKDTNEMKGYLKRRNKLKINRAIHRKTKMGGIKRR